jgi:UDP:flavonoid glycosyltransferase YjiC (YdhE family)
MRILFASPAADGHFNPLTGVATHLATRGHDVRWYAGPQYARRVEALGIPVLPYRRAVEVTGDNINTLFPERARLKGPRLVSFDLDTFFVGNVEEQFADLVDLRGDFPFDVFVCDGGMYVEQLVAEELGIPVFATAMSAVVPDAASPPPFFGLRPARTVVDRARHRVVRAMLRSGMRRGVQHYNDILAAHGIPPIPADGFPHVPMASARKIFLDGVPGLEFPGYRPPANAEFVGPLVPTRAALGADVPLPDVVTGHTVPVVAVSQGTVDNTDPGKLIEPTLEALAGDGYVVVATTGGSRTEELRARFGGPGVVVEDFIPYASLFPHVDVFVSNGGYGSVVAALRHGVPVVGAGTREGKNDVNARLAVNRLGADLRSEHPGPARIRRAVERVLADATVLANVERLRAELAAHDAVATVTAAVEAVELSPAA